MAREGGESTRFVIVHPQNRAVIPRKEKRKLKQQREERSVRFSVVILL